MNIGKWRTLAFVLFLPMKNAIMWSRSTSTPITPQRSPTRSAETSI
ncbi:MAG TPA: hypothetical protein VMV86_02425 [Methanosarcinales archaeon]|nr:hypothetical protein [Methanosarcinales archaeon]